MMFLFKTLTLSFLTLSLSTSAYAHYYFQLLPNEIKALTGMYVDVDDGLSRIHNVDPDLLNSGTSSYFEGFQEAHAPHRYQSHVLIPEGILSDGTFIHSFVAAQYPVTREFWNRIMGHMPDLVPEEERETWNDCPHCPVTYVRLTHSEKEPAEIHDFLDLLNQKEAKSLCRYDLPTQWQLQYLIRADREGFHQNTYSNGITAANAKDYITYQANSDGRIQSVGKKKLNRFQIELGNVKKFTRAGNALDVNWKTAIWNSKSTDLLRPGSFGPGLGFQLIQICENNLDKP